MEKQSIAIFE